MNIGAYAKGVVMVAGAIITSLAPFYGSQHWFPAVTTGITAVAGILVPNLPSKTTTTVKPDFWEGNSK